MLHTDLYITYYILLDITYLHYIDIYTYYYYIFIYYIL